MGLGFAVSKEGVVNGLLKNKKSWQILPMSRNLAQPPKGSRTESQILCLSVSNLLFYQVTTLFRLGLGF